MSTEGILVNPFDAIKAVNLTDDQIFDMYVEPKRITRMASPISPTPLFLTGGKGSGRTHLLRYWSYPVQLHGYDNDHRKTLEETGYLGIYVLLGGINASRLVSTRVSDALSSTLFGAHLDLAVTASLCRVLQTLEDGGLLSPNETDEFVDRVLTVLDSTVGNRASIEYLLDELGRIRQLLDRDVNVSMDEGRAPRVLVTFQPGDLFLRLPSLVSASFKALNGVRISYLLDEFENVAVPHQRHIHSLIREKPPESSLVIGSRTYGIRTYETLSAGERNVEGSEFIEVQLDFQMRLGGEKVFYDFCSDIASKRFWAAGMRIDDTASCFETGEYEEVEFLAGLSGDRRSPAMRRLMVRLSHTSELEKKHVSRIETLLTDRNDRLMEKIALLAFYKDSARWRPSVKVAKRIATQVGEHRSGRVNRISRMMGHFRSDLIAQLYRENRRRQEWAGFRLLVRLSDGNPRNFMNLMRLVFKWAEFMNCSSPELAAIPASVQNQSIREASDWFYRDGEVVGPHSTQVRIAIDRLGELFEKLRYADKIVESSLCSIAFNISLVDEETAGVIRQAEAWSLLVQRPYRRDRNRSRQRYVLQINRMLAPRWDLPLGRRGVLELNPAEVVAIFSRREPDSFDRLLRSRVDRLQFAWRVPRYERLSGAEDGGQETLFES